MKWSALLCLFGAAQLLAAPPVVKTVPWVPASPLTPHDTWATKTITLKGTCDVQGAGYTYEWDFGDGTLPHATGTVASKYAVQATHAYNAPVGTVFTATLTVRNTSTGEAGSANYYVVIQNKTLPIEVNVAIDEGLWYLYKIAQHPSNPGQPYPQYRWNNIQYGNHYANATASAVQAFLVNGHLESQAANPYSEAVMGGIDYLMSTLYAQSMSLQAGANPDSNGNGIGLSVNSDRPIYESGAVIDALVATRTPDRTARTGNATYVLGKTYQTIVQDMVDMYAWGQVDSGWAYGGWRYGWNSESDNSAAQWGAIGMLAAERTPAHVSPGPDGVLGTADDIILDYWGIVPQWVKDRNKSWLTYSYNSGGWFGYTGTGANREFSTGPCGMVQLAFDGFTKTEARWVNCERFIAVNWDSFVDLGWGRDARYYSFYAFFKAMTLALPAPVTHFAYNSFDWYSDNTKGLARVLVNRQNSSGYWSYDGWPYVGEQTAAAWNVLILRRTLFERLPVAIAEAIPNPALVGQLVTFDGSDSYHQDPGLTIDSWEWDFNEDGVTDATGPIVTHTFPAADDYPVKLTVTDNGSPERFASTIIIVAVRPPPVAPTAVAGGPYVFCPQAKPWYLDGRSSVNPDEGVAEPGCTPDTIIEYAWDLDGDLDFNDAFGAVIDVTAYYEARGPGSYLVQLKVTDSASQSFCISHFPNQSDTDSGVVHVFAATDPVCSCVNNLVARPKSGKIQLVWTHAPGTHHYNVYRATISGGPYLRIGSTTSTYSTYLDATVVNGTTYYYVVREAALNDDELCQSNQASAKATAR